jgi:hypothetical protein
VSTPLSSSSGAPPPLSSLPPLSSTSPHVQGQPPPPPGTGTCSSAVGAGERPPPPQLPTAVGRLPGVSEPLPPLLLATDGRSPSACRPLPPPIGHGRMSPPGTGALPYVLQARGVPPSLLYGMQAHPPASYDVPPFPFVTLDATTATLRALGGSMRGPLCIGATSPFPELSMPPMDAPSSSATVPKLAAPSFSGAGAATTAAKAALVAILAEAQAACAHSLLMSASSLAVPSFPADIVESPAAGADGHTIGVDAKLAPSAKHTASRTKLA